VRPGRKALAVELIGFASTRKSSRAGWAACDHADCVRVRVVEGLRNVVHRRGGQLPLQPLEHSAVVQRANSLSSTPVSSSRLRRRASIVAKWIRRKIRAAQFRDQRLPELLGHAHHEQPAVRGTEELHRNRRRV